MDEKRQPRELKFRAWNPEEKIMGQPFTIGDFFDAYPMSDNIDTTGIIYLQWTGLKDKNGKEIYEGDVDSHGRHIEYRDGAFHVVQNNGQTFDYLSHMKHIEIIGNIYQPELSES